LFYFHLENRTQTRNLDASQLSVEQPIDVEQLRQRLAKMADAELRRFSEASRFMCSPGANLGKPPRDVFVLQLNEALGEWQRRHDRKK
jgi:hypothetical protein